MDEEKIGKVWSLADFRHHSAQYGIAESSLRLETPRMKYIPVGVDIAKHLIQVHFIDENIGEVVDKQLRSRDFLEYFSNRNPCLIDMEACGGSQHWGSWGIKSGCYRPASLRHSSWAIRGEVLHHAD